MVLESWVAERSLATTQVLDCWKPIIFHSSYHEHSFTIHKLKPTYLKINKKEAWNAQLETLYINCTLQQPVSIMLRHFKHSSSSFRTLGLKIATGQWQFSFSFQNGNVSFSDVSTFSPPKFFFSPQVDDLFANCPNTSKTFLILSEKSGTMSWCRRS